MDTPKSSEKPDSIELLDRYFTGECSDDERLRADRLLSSVPDGKRAILAAVSNEPISWLQGQQVAESDKVSGLQGQQIESELQGQQIAESDKYDAAAVRVWKKLQTSDHIYKESRLGESRTQIPQSHGFFSRFTGYRNLAVLLPAVIVAVGVFAWVGSSSSDDDLSTASLTYSTPAGQQSVVRLDDGTTVELSVASTLEVSKGFNSSNRVVKLDGHARFSVNQTTSNPFVVITKSAAVQVLGTEFVVRDYSTDIRSSVSVLSGRVNVEATKHVGNSDTNSVKSHGYILDKGERISIPAASHDSYHAVREQAIYKSKLSADDYAAFSGLITFDETPLHSAIIDLSRWVGIPISLNPDDPSLKNLKITGRFKCTTRDQLIQILERTLDVRVSQEGKTLVVSRNIHSSTNTR